MTQEFTRCEAQQRADEIRGFRAELARLHGAVCAVLRDGIAAVVRCASRWIEMPNIAVLAANLALRMRCVGKVCVCRIVGVLCSVVG